MMKKITELLNSLKSALKVANVYDKNIMRYASSLSFHTMLSLLPILMVSLSIFMQMPSFKAYYEKIKTFIFANLLPTHQDTLSSYIEQFLANSVGLGITGFAAVIFTSVMFFSEFEGVICNISGAKKRSFFASLSTYWTLMTLAPVGLGGSFYVSGVLQNLLNQTELTRWINLLAILPYLIIWAIFAVTYAVSINREISAKAIMIASFITSVFWWILKILFVQYVFYNKTYLSIYGSFSVLLFFLLWIYISWILFLYGVKVCVFLNDKKDRQEAEQGTK